MEEILLPPVLQLQNGLFGAGRRGQENRVTHSNVGAEGRQPGSVVWPPFSLLRQLQKQKLWGLTVLPRAGTRGWIGISAPSFPWAHGILAPVTWPLRFPGEVMVCWCKEARAVESASPQQRASVVAQMGKACNAGDSGLIPGSGAPFGKGKGNPV